MIISIPNFPPPTSPVSPPTCFPPNLMLSLFVVVGNPPSPIIAAHMSMGVDHAPEHGKTFRKQ